jgi:isoamylase
MPLSPKKSRSSAASPSTAFENSATSTTSASPGLSEPLGQNHPKTGPLSQVSATTWKRAKFPLGAHRHPTREAVTFAVYASKATRVLLEIYSAPMGQQAAADYWLALGPDGAWRGCVTWDPGTPLFYGIRCWGPNWPFAAQWRRGNSGAGFLCDVDAFGNRFNPNKLLLDPYAREMSHDKEGPEVFALGHHGGAYGSGAGGYRGVDDHLPEQVRREVDTGLLAPKGVYFQDKTDRGRKPRIPAQDTVIYEAHLRGLTRHPSAGRWRQILKGQAGFETQSDIPAHWRGTYLGALLAAKYIKGLGATTIEFLPVQECANDHNGHGMSAAAHSGTANYWGYMTQAFFAPDRRFASTTEPGAATREFKQMVKAYHDEGLEVYLDVVFNHHGEGGLWGLPSGKGPDVNTAEMLSLRGLDNTAYYALAADPRYYWDSSGCGNNLDGSKPMVQQLVLDSLRYWSEEMGVDGFRFDLATVLGRQGDINHEFSQAAHLLHAIEKLSVELGFKVIAEAWDTAGDGYQVGQFPRGWAEWNGHYRDSVRRFLKGDGNAFDFASVMNGDYDRYADQGGPHKSVNFITAHDGFTLLDLVSYGDKNNGAAWPFGPSDGGSSNNDSWDSRGSATLRRQRLRNFMTVLAFARGVPMLVAGDEMGRTQNGNNNPYNLDNVGMWLNWDSLATSAPNRVAVTESSPDHPYHDNFGDAGPSPWAANSLFGFTRFVLKMRKDHPSLRQDRYGDLSLDSGDDVTHWFKKPDGFSDLMGYERSMLMRLDGSEIGDADFVVLVNMEDHPVTFTLPSQTHHRWVRRIDTAAWAEPEGNAWDLNHATPIDPHLGSDLAHYSVQPWSIVVLQEVTRVT